MSMMLTLQLPLWGSLNFTTSVRLTHTWITTVRQLPTDMMLTFTLRVWDSQLHNRLRDTHTHIHNWVTTMRFTHNYATGVRLTITQWSKAHSHSYLSYHHEAHSHLCYMCKAKFCNRCEAHSQLHYRCEARSHYIKCVTWVTTIRFTVMLCVYGSLTFTSTMLTRVTTVRLTHSFTMSVRLTHTWVTTVRLTVTHGYDALFYVTSTYETHNYTIV